MNKNDFKYKVRFWSSWPLLCSDVCRCDFYCNTLKELNDNLFNQFLWYDNNYDISIMDIENEKVFIYENVRNVLKYGGIH